MKLAISIVVAVVMPFGFVVLAGVMLSRMLAKRGQDSWPRRLTIVRGCYFPASPDSDEPEHAVGPPQWATYI